MRFLSSPPSISDFIVKFKGDSNELTNKETERLVTSILAKAPQSDYSEISINKFLKKILKLIDPLISNKHFWKILSEFGKPIKSELLGPSKVGERDILGTYAPNKQAKISCRGSSSIFADALSILNTKKLSSMQNRVQLKMDKNNFSNNLESSGLSRNHEQLSKDHHFISSYPISEEAFKTFKQTGNIGISPEEREQEIHDSQRIQAQADREKTTAHSFYSRLLEEARIGNQQLREVETLQEQLKQDPSISLTEKEKNIIQRAEKYQQYKNKFYQDNPDIDRDEF